MPFAALLGLQLVGIALLVAMPRTTKIVQPTSTLIVPVAMPIVTAVPTVTTIERLVSSPSPVRPACPPARRDAPALTPPRLPEPIIGITPAPSNAGWIAAWSEQHLYASFDAGATFERVLDGSGAMRAATFDCYGRAIALRDSGVGIRDGAQETWHRVDGLELVNPAVNSSPAGLLGGGPDVVVVGNTIGTTNQARVSVSSDGGASWRIHDLGDTHEMGARIAGRQREDGRIDVAVVFPDCMSAEILWAKISDRRVDVFSESIGDGERFEVYGDVLVVGSRWRHGGGTWQDIKGAFPVDWAEPIPGPSPVVVSGDEVFRVRGGDARPVHARVPRTETTMDAAGRVWFLACGQPVLAGRELVDLAARGCTVER